MEFSKSVPSLSLRPKSGQAALLELSHDLVPSHLVDLLLFLARHAILLDLCLAYSQQLG